MQFRFCFETDFITETDHHSILIIADAKQRDRRQIQALGVKVERRGDTFTENSATSSQDSQASQAVNTDYNDRQRALNRYKKAVEQLKEAIKIRKGPWDSFDFEEFNDEPEGFDDSQFKNKINAILISRETSIKDRKGWSKFTYAVEYVFTAFSPFAKNLLMVTKNAQSVMPFNLI